MDNVMEVDDDLFGEIRVQQSSVKGLPQLVDSLHRSGCQQKVTWSKTGCLAYISQDGTKVKFRYLCCKPDDRKWSLSKDSLIETPTGFDGRHKLVHLQWNSNGTDLAVVDAAGRIATLLVTFTALNVLNITRPLTMDQQEDDQAAVVGMTWLNTDRQAAGKVMPYVLYASKENAQWNWVTTNRRPFGPFHNRALLCVTRSGTLKLLYQRPDTRWNIAVTELRSALSSTSVVTHAALAPTSDTRILVAFQTADRKIHAVRVQINGLEAKHEAQNGHRQPNFVVEHVDDELIPNPFEEQSGSVQTINNAFSLRLSYLEIIQSSDAGDRAKSQSIILACYSTPLDVMVLPGQLQGLQSVIFRWEVTELETSLHSSFDNTGSTTSAKPLKTKSELLSMAPTALPHLVASMHVLDAGLTVALALGDGSIRFLDPQTMTEHSSEKDSDKVSSLSQAGFVYPTTDSGLHVTLSPNGCVAASLDEDGHMALRQMTYNPIVAPDAPEDIGLEAAATAIGLTLRRASLITQPVDDVLMLALQHHTIDPYFVESLYKSSFRDQEISSEIDKKQMLPKLLSLQAALGLTPESDGRPLPAAFSYLIMNIRCTGLFFAGVLSTLRQSNGAEFRDSAILDFPLHNIHYALSLFHHIVDSLFTAFDEPSKPVPPLVALLLMSSWSRYFLQYVSRALRGLATWPRSQTSGNVTADLLKPFLRMAQLIEPPPLRMETIEKVLGTVEKLVQVAFTEARFNAANRAAAEREMLVYGRIPTVLAGVWGRVVTELLPSIRDELNRLQLFTEDYTWLGLDVTKGNGSGEKIVKRMQVDVLKKKVLRNLRTARGKGVRKCVRCSGLSEDLVPPRAYPRAMMPLLSRCACDGSFAKVRLDEEK